MTVYCHRSGGFRCHNTASHGKVPFETLDEPLRPFAALSEADKRAVNGSSIGTFGDIWPLLYIHGGPDCRLVFSNSSIQDVLLGCPNDTRDAPQVTIPDITPASTCTQYGTSV